MEKWITQHHGHWTTRQHIIGVTGITFKYMTTWTNWNNMENGLPLPHGHGAAWNYWNNMENGQHGTI